MTDTEREINYQKAEKMKLFFCISPQNTASSCCCGCTLRVGTQILCALYIIGVLSTIIRGITYVSNYYYSYGFYYSSIFIGVFQLVGPGLILASTLNNQFNLAYLGNIFYTIFILVGFLNTIILPVSQNGIFYVGDYIVYYLLYVPSYLLAIYFAFIIYSFVKELGLGNFAKIDGQQTLIVASEYQNIGNQGNHGGNPGYTPNVANINVSTSTQNQIGGQQDYVQPTQSTKAYEVPQGNQGYDQSQSNQSNQGNQGYQPPTDY